MLSWVTGLAPDKIETFPVSDSQPWVCFGIGEQGGDGTIMQEPQAWNSSPEVTFVTLMLYALQSNHALWFQKHVSTWNLGIWLYLEFFSDVS